MTVTPPSPTAEDHQTEAVTALGGVPTGGLSVVPHKDDSHLGQSDAITSAGDARPVSGGAAAASEPAEVEHQAQSAGALARRPVAVPERPTLAGLSRVLAKASEIHALSPWAESDALIVRQDEELIEIWQKEERGARRSKPRSTVC